MTISGTTAISTTQDQWNGNYFLGSPIFAPLHPVSAQWSTSFSHWPSLADYQMLLEKHAPELCSRHGARIHFVEQDIKPQYFAQGYEPRIYLKGEVQTRQQNWHDFFQVMMWSSLPESKSLINALHYQASYDRVQRQQSHRNDMENLLTQFDECGGIVLCSDPDLLQLVYEHRWLELFWENRISLCEHFSCIVFGHALYEKALNPYIGMTAHCLCLQVAPPFLRQTMQQQLQQLDQYICNEFSSGRYHRARDLQPFPLLGMPGWSPMTQDPAFYANTAYFRPRRNRN